MSVLVLAAALLIRPCIFAEPSCKPATKIEWAAWQSYMIQRNDEDLLALEAGHHSREAMICRRRTDDLNDLLGPPPSMAGHMDYLERRQ